MPKTFIDKLAFIKIENRKVMLNWEKDKSVWIMPGGKREVGESDMEALARELMEELSVELDKGSAKHLETYEGQAHGKPEGTMVRITCYTGEYKGKITPNHPVERIGWVNSTESAISIPGRMLLDDLKNRNLID